MNVPEFDERDAIESAVNQVLVSSDQTHYYLGLAVGLLAIMPPTPSDRDRIDNGSRS